MILRADTTEENFSDFESIAIETIKNTERKMNYNFLNEQNIHKLWDNFKQPNIQVIGVPKEERWGEKKIFKDIMAKFFPNLMKCKRSQREKSIKNATPSYIIINLLKIRDKEKVSKSEERRLPTEEQR